MGRGMEGLHHPLEQKGEAAHEPRDVNLDGTNRALYGGGVTEHRDKVCATLFASQMQVKTCPLHLKNGTESSPRLVESPGVILSGLETLIPGQMS